MADINLMSPHSGRVLKGNNSAINIADLSSASLGQDGSIRITTTTETAPDTGYIFIAIQVSEDAVFNTLTGNMENSTGLSLAAGTVIYGRFTNITLTSGKVIAYMGV